MKIIKQEKSKLLPRIDVVALEDHMEKRTPSMNEVKEELSKILKVEKDLILIDSIYSRFGKGESKIVAYVYDTKKDLINIVKRSKKQRDKEAKEMKEAKKMALEEKTKNLEKKDNEEIKENGEKETKE